MVEDDIYHIKKYYGEDFAHFCKSNFSTILETPGILFEIISSNFFQNKYLYSDLEKQGKLSEFKEFIYTLYTYQEEEKPIMKTGKTPFELMAEAGYKLYECKTEEDIQYFKKYYQKNEELCTFLGGRLNKCFVFFAVREDALTVAREDKPERDKKDGYGTSVISIQFDRGAINILSIKNRYNHTVKLPDATFSNKLDNIIPGLTESFNRTYGFNIKSTTLKDFNIRGYVRAGDGKYYKYNNRIHDICYCPDNIIIDNYKVINKYYQEKERYIVADYFIIDLIKKTIKIYDPNLVDSFVNAFKNITKILIKNNEDKTKTVDVYLGNNILSITLDSNNNIIAYVNNNLPHIDKRFLIFNSTLKKLIINGTYKIDDLFLILNEYLEYFEAESLEEVGNNFLESNKTLKKLSLPNLETVKDDFCSETNIEEIYCPKLIYVGNNFFKTNNKIKTIDFPLLENTGDYFFNYCNNLEKASLPSLLRFGNFCLSEIKPLEDLYVPEVIYVGDNFGMKNRGLKKIVMPMLERTGCNFFLDTKTCEALFPSLIEANNEFMASSLELENFYAPVLKKAENNFLSGMTIMKNIFLPEIEELGYGALQYADKLETFIAPNVKIIGEKFLYFNKNIKNIEVPSLEEFNTNSLECNYFAKLKVLKQLYANDKNKLEQIKKIINASIDSNSGLKIIAKK